MAVYNYSKYKIRIDSDSQKTQGLQVGDVVRRQYAERNQSIYSLMVVVETGVDAIDGKESPYFIGALLDGDEPKSGELPDFVRITSLTNTDRSGAMYLTASDSDAPYMDIIDGMATVTLEGLSPRSSSRQASPAVAGRYSQTVPQAM